MRYGLAITREEEVLQLHILRSPKALYVTINITQLLI